METEHERYVRLKAEADAWLQAHPTATSARRQVRACDACAQLAQYIDGAAVKHFLPHSSTPCVPIGV